jgi:putative ABC transport system substrate-binding protein
LVDLSGGTHAAKGIHRGLIGAVVAWSLDARAQQSAMPVIGVLSSALPGDMVDRMHAFRRGRGETGYVEGRNVAIEFRWAEGHYDRLPALGRRRIAERAFVTTAVRPPRTISSRRPAGTRQQI